MLVGWLVGWFVCVCSRGCLRVLCERLYSSSGSFLKECGLTQDWSGKPTGCDKPLKSV